MARALKLRTFRIGAARRPGEGLRIGAARRPPRGVPRARWRSGGFFDVWFPVVAPSEALLRRARGGLDAAAARKRFFDAYRRELSRPPASHAVALLARLAERTPIAVGCYCEDERRCHRSVLREEIAKAAGRA
jgi:uncharacterized protein YeaO (DUF488 family)